MHGYLAQIALEQFNESRSMQRPEPELFFLLSSDALGKCHHRGAQILQMPTAVGSNEQAGFSRDSPRSVTRR